MEWKKMKAGIRRFFSTTLVAVVLVTGVLSQPETAHAEVYKWMSTAATLQLGQIYEGIAQPGINGWGDYYGHAYIYLPVNMNVTLKIKENGTKHFDNISIYDGNGQRIKFLYNGWKYDRNTNQSIFVEKMNLSSGGYYINPHEMYNAVWGESLTQSYTIEVTGTLTSRTRITALKKLPKKKARVVWKRVGSVSGYEVFRSTSAKGNYKKIATVSGNTYTDKKLAKRRNYYYKIRAYVVIGNEVYYTPFSSAKKIRM